MRSRLVRLAAVGMGTARRDLAVAKMEFAVLVADRRWRAGVLRGWMRMTLSEARQFEVTDVGVEQLELG